MMWLVYFLATWTLFAVIVAPITGRFLAQSGQMYMDPETAADIDAHMRRHPSWLAQQKRLNGDAA